MKNIMSRSEYLALNEGFRDTVVRGMNKIKSLFKLGMKKIKNFIAVFDSNGRLMPVVTPHALIDHFSNVDGAKVFAPKSMSDAVVSAGGSGCSDTANYGEEDGIYSYCPKFSTRDEMVDWFESKAYEKEADYQNFLSMPKVIKESIELYGDELNEDLDSKFSSRIKYSVDEDLEGIWELTSKEFEEELRDRIFAYTTNDDYKPGNILLFGAPGIGKSTIPRLVCDAYNEGKATKDKVCLITVDAQTIQPGDLMMPKMPDEKSILDAVEAKGSFAYDTILDKFKANKEQLNALSTMLSKISQSKSDMVPQQWLPAYKPTGDEHLDAILDDLANGGVHTRDGGETEKTGSGGLLFFDELLRADQMIFQQTMNLFSNSRTINGWRLGSKWAIMACTNRPADSEAVANVWKELKNDRALEQRFPVKFLVLPEPEKWRDWARDYLKCDELILDYIFEEKSSTLEGEFPRWHTFLPGDADESQVNSISPRTWELAIRAINSYIKKNSYYSVADMDKSEIVRCLRGMFDKDFLDNFATWIDENSNVAKIEDIIKEPLKVKAKRSEKKDDVKIIESIREQVMAEKENGHILSDDEMKNIILWFGVNFPSMVNMIETDFIQYLDKLVKSEEVLETYHESLRMFNAAYPTEEVLKMMKEDEEFAEYIDIEKVKELCKKYFPKNIDENDEFITKNSFNLDEE